MSTPIYPMAMIPKTNIPFKLYFLAFPEKWKEIMTELQLSVDPKFNTMYNLKTNVLYGYLNGWLDDVVMIGTLKKGSDDSKWFVSLRKPDTEKICEIIQIWAAAEYSDHFNKTPETDKLVDEFLTLVEPSLLDKGLSEEDVVLFDSEGRAMTDYAFNAFALYAADALNGKTIDAAGHELTFSVCDQKKLMSQPLVDEKTGDRYAIGLQLSVQTTPPERACMLLIDCSVKRFISSVRKDNIFLSDNIHSYVKTGKNKYRIITILHKAVKETVDDKEKYIHRWDQAERKCYDLYDPKMLPSAEDVLCHPEKYLSEQSDPQILLPFKNGMEFTKNRVGTGIPVKDKCLLFTQLSKLMSGFAYNAEPARPITQSKVIHCKKEMKSEELFKVRRERLKLCTGLSGLCVEIYGHASDSDLADRLTDKFYEYIGGNEYQSIFPVKIVKKELGTLGDMMCDSSFVSHCQKINQIKRMIPASDEITGAIIILPNTENVAGDPKHALRAGFADTNRITQFITPDGSQVGNDDPEPSEHRVEGAVRDLLRQFGYTEFFEKRNMKNNPAFDADTVGMYVMHQMKPLWAERSKLARDVARFLPIYVTYNVKKGIITVDCDLFEKRHLSYPDALIELSKVSREKDFVQKCNDAARGGFRTKLLGLRSLYREEPALLLVQANGITRLQWYGLTDKKISEYDNKERYVPEKIEIGTKTLSDMKSFCETGVRIIRVRDNISTHEVPDYYTELNSEGDNVSSSGGYCCKDVFWGLESRPNTREYTLSYKISKFDKPSMNFDECSLVEYYPIQLQIGDDAEQWAAYANYLREVMPETNRSVHLPAPLHFAGLMEEYLLLVKPHK